MRGQRYVIAGDVRANSAFLLLAISSSWREPLGGPMPPSGMMLLLEPWRMGAGGVWMVVGWGIGWIGTVGKARWR